MKKIILILLSLVLASAPILSGCDLITRDDVKYFNTVVIRVGDEEITREEFIAAYNMYAPFYFNQGFSAEVAFEAIKNNLINNKILVSYARENFEPLSQYEINKIYEEVYESINSQIDSIENQVRLELGFDISDDEEDEDESSPVYEEYEKRVEIIEGEIVYIIPEFEDVDPIGGFVRIENEALIDQIGQENYDDVKERAFDRYIRRLRNLESWKGFTPEESTSDLVLGREIERIFKIVEERTLINRFERYYKKNVGLDVDSVISRYVEHVKDSFVKYNPIIDESLSSYHSAMGSSPQNVFYHPSVEYIEVSHILIEFSEDQKTQIQELRADFDANNISAQVYNLQLEQIISEVTVRARDENGVEYGDEKSAEQVLIELEAALTLASDLDEKGRVFNEFIYKYNSDPGMFNAERPYVVNIDTDVTDKMIKPFADKARDLHSYGVKGEISGLVEGIVFEDRQGPNFNINDPKDSVFGIHILFYHGVRENIYDYNDMFIEVEDGVIEYNIDPILLFNTNLITGLEKSYFDLILEKMSSDAHTKYRTNILNSIKEDLEIKVYENRLKDFR